MPPARYLPCDCAAALGLKNADWSLSMSFTAGQLSASASLVVSYGSLFRKAVMRLWFLHLMLAACASRAPPEPSESRNAPEVAACRGDGGQGLRQDPRSGARTDAPTCTEAPRNARERGSACGDYVAGIRPDRLKPVDDREYAKLLSTKRGTRHAESATCTFAS